MSEHDPFAPHEGNAPEGALSVDAEVQESTEEDVPRGTRDEVLKWVGDDKERARRALDAEQQEKQPRKTLVEQLQSQLEDE